MHYIETGSQDPRFNLAFEEYLLGHRRQGDWLMLWQNRNTVVVGRNQNPLEEIDPAFVRDHGTLVVRRSTGGGAVYHDLGNLNYSFITDADPQNPLDFGRFGSLVCGVLAGMGVQAQVSGRNDLTVGDRKFSGTAQRIEGGRVLHHGTLLFDADLDMVAGALRADPAKFQSKSSKSVRSRVGNLRPLLGEMTLEQFWARLQEGLGGQTPERLSPGELQAVQALAREKYGSWEWTWGRAPRYTMKNRRRWPAGTLEALLLVEEGRIRQAEFRGDFLAAVDCAPAQQALEGVRFDRAAAGKALEGLDLTLMFGGITREELLDTIFEPVP